MPDNSSENPTPLVKWVGGKRQLQAPILSKILEVFDPKIGTYFEPFFGGGAMFFALKPQKALASDLNAGLVNLYQQVKENADALMARVEQFEKTYNAIDPSKQKDFYLQQRQVFNSRDEKGDFLGRHGIEGAALFVFLNKAGFNGMYRENVAGDFNIPFGKREKLNLAEDKNLRLASSALRALTVLNQDYKLTVADAVPGDLVYFDPPYAPLSKTSSFEGYNSSNLAGFDQEELRDVFINLTERNVHCLVSNSSAPLIEDLYKGFNLVPLTASRAISASADGRKKVKEYLIDNFEQVQG